MAKKENLVPLQDILERLDELYDTIASIDEEAADEVSRLQEELSDTYDKKKIRTTHRIITIQQDTFNGIRQLMKDRQWTKYVAFDGRAFGCATYTIKTDQYYVEISLYNRFEFEDTYKWHFYVSLYGMFRGKEDELRQRENMKLLADKIRAADIVTPKYLYYDNGSIRVVVKKDKDLMPTIEKVFTIMFE